MKLVYRYRKESKFILRNLYQAVLMLAPVFLLLQFFNGLSDWPGYLAFPMGEAVVAAVVMDCCFALIHYLLTHVRSKRKLIFLCAGLALLLALTLAGILLLRQGWILSAIAGFFKTRAYLYGLFVIVLISFLLHFKFAGRCGVAVMLLAVMLWSSVQKISIHVVPTSLAVFYILDALLLLSQKKQYGMEKGQRSSRRLVPVLLVICLSCLFFPVKEDPISWEKVMDAYHNILDAKDQLLYDIYAAFQNTSAEFGIGIMGYSENGGKLGGGLVQNEITMAEIKTNYKIRNRMYLTGSIFDTYTGDGWEMAPHRKDAESEQTPEFRMNFLLHLYAMSRSGALDLNDSSQFHFINADFLTKTLKTKSVFYPQDCLNVSATVINNDIGLEGNNLRAEKVFKRNQGYSMRYLEVNEQSEAFQEMMQSFPSTKYYYNEEEYARMLENLQLCEKDSVRRILMALAETADYKQLMDYAKTQHETELALPLDIPERVRELALSLTQTERSDYDKVMAIRSYLKENYEYTTDIKKAKGDSVDHFLFESRKGYCTYFASAMTVLSRMAGIPARYVEGISYRKNPEKGETKELQGKYAHAWSEVFIEGYGYLVMDATPGYEQKSNVKWPEPVTDTADGQTATTQPWQANQYGEHYLPTDVPSELTQTENASGRQTAENRKIAVRAGVVLGFLFLMLLVIWILIRAFLRWNYKHMNYRQQMNVQMGEILERLAQLQLPEMKEEAAPGRGLREILSGAKQIKWDQTEIQKIDLDKLCELYEKSRYGSYEIQPMDIFYMEQVNQILKKKGKKNRESKKQITR